MGATIPCLCLQFHLWFSHTWYIRTGLLVPAGSRFGLKWQMGECVLESIRFNYEKETQLLYLGLRKLSSIRHKPDMWSPRKSTLSINKCILAHYW